MAIPNFIHAVLIFFALFAIIANAQSPAIFDITKYGAKSNADISQALLSAWKDACLSATPARVVVPAGTWQLSQVKMVGPNKSPIQIQIQGTLVAPLGQLPDKNAEWITINYASNLEIYGGGILEGNGVEAWKRNDCSKNSNCMKLPYNLSFNFLNNTYIHDITTKDSKNFHVNLIGSHNIKFQRFTISAPDESPNTDGIHLALGTNITVIDSIIKTGDDCVSMGDGISDVHVENVECGPGHGVSIGSLGGNPREKDVVGVFVKNVKFFSTINGVRIKTRPSGPAKLAIRDIHFEDITVDNVSYPIVIDQEYCPHNMCDKSHPSLIKISDVFIKNVHGTSQLVEAVTLVCSSANPCQNVQLSDIDLKYNGNQGTIKTICGNIKPILGGKINPPICANA